MKLLFLFLCLGLSLSAGNNPFVIIQTRLAPDSKCVLGHCLTPQGVYVDVTNAGPMATLSIVYFSQTYPTWELLEPNGPQIKLGGNEQIVEWLVEPIANQSPRPHSLAIQVDSLDPWTSENLSEVLVFGFNEVDVCLRGREKSWAAARALSATSLCTQYLKPVKPYRLTPQAVPR